MTKGKEIIRVFHMTPERVKALQEEHPDAEIQAHYAFPCDWCLSDTLEIWKPITEEETK